MMTWDDLYTAIRMAGLTTSQRDFSRRILGGSQGWLSSSKARHRQPTIPVLARLLTLMSDLDTQYHDAIATGQLLSSDQQAHAGMVWRIKQTLADELHQRARGGAA